MNRNIWRPSRLQVPIEALSIAHKSPAPPAPTTLTAPSSPPQIRRLLPQPPQKQVWFVIHFKNKGMRKINLGIQIINTKLPNQNTFAIS